MGVELVRKRVSNSLRSCYRSASKHPFLVFMVFVLIWTYRSFPVLFSLLVHASPVIASTLVLLGTLLFYGHANAPHIQKEAKSHHHDVNLVFGGIGNTEIDEETYLVNNMNVNDDHKLGSLIDSCVSRGNKKLTQEGKSELGKRKPLLVNRCGQFQPFETGNSKLRSSDGSRRCSFDPSHSVLGHIDDDIKGWETGSDVVESSSSSASMAEIFPMPDELHPLLDSDVPLGSGEIIQETDDDDYDDHDDIEIRDDDEDETFITWTEDDQRNLMNLGTLELERNQRLESLIARQKAIKNMRMLAEKNMVNISPDIRFMDTHISTARNTPFELPNHSHENILGSAPSNIMQRRNPFDLPYDPRGGKPDRVVPTFQSDSVALQTNHPLGRGHESSDVGHSTLGTYSLPERVASDTESIGSTHTSDVNEHIIPRNRFSEDDDTVKLHQVAEGVDRSDEVKITGDNTGYEDKTSNKSSSSSFFDVTDDIYDGDDDNDNAEEYSSIDNSTTPDSEDEQDSEDSDTEEEGLPQRLKSWLIGW